MSELQHAIDWYKEGERDVDFVQHLADRLIVALAERDTLIEYMEKIVPITVTMCREDLLSRARAEEGSGECHSCKLVDEASCAGIDGVQDTNGKCTHWRAEEGMSERNAT